MWRFLGNACVVARARRSRNARMVDAMQWLQCFSCVDPCNRRCLGCKINAVHVSLQLRSLLVPLPVECYRRYAEHAADTWHLEAGGARGPAGILACKLTNPIRILSAGGASPSHDGRLPVPFFDAKNIGGDALSWHTTVLPCRQDSCCTAMCTTHTNATQGLRQPLR